MGLNTCVHHIGSNTYEGCLGFKQKPDSARIVVETAPKAKVFSGVYIARRATQTKPNTSIALQQGKNRLVPMSMASNEEIVQLLHKRAPSTSRVWICSCVYTALKSGAVLRASFKPWTIKHQSKTISAPAKSRDIPSNCFVFTTVPSKSLNCLQVLVLCQSFPQALPSDSKKPSLEII